MADFFNRYCLTVAALRLQTILGYLLIGLAFGIPTAMMPGSGILNGMLPPNQNQGVSGLVVLLQGNQMPTVGSNRSTPEPVSTDVWVFSGRIQAKGPRWAVAEASRHSNLVARVRSDAQGEFFVSLPPGEYTLFAQYGSNLYLNSFLGDGSYASVQVTQGKVTKTRLVNTERAAF